MNLLKYLLDQAEGHPAHDLARMKENGVQSDIPTNNYGMPANVNMPLHVAMMHRKIPYSSWPQAAKDELDPKTRAGFEAEMDPKLFAGPTGQSVGDRVRQIEMEQLMTGANKATAEQGNPAQAVAGASAGATGDRLSAMLADPAQAPAPVIPGEMTPDPRGMKLQPTSLEPPKGKEWMAEYTDLLLAQRTGQMSVQEAEAKMAEIMKANGMSPQRNPFSPANR